MPGPEAQKKVSGNIFPDPNNLNQIIMLDLDEIASIETKQPRQRATTTSAAIHDLQLNIECADIHLKRAQEAVDKDLGKRELREHLNKAKLRMQSMRATITDLQTAIANKTR